MHSVLLTSLLDILFAAAPIAAVVILWQNARVFRFAGAELARRLLTIGLLVWAAYHIIDVIVLLGAPFVLDPAGAEAWTFVIQNRLRWFTDAGATAFLLAGFLLLMQRISLFLQGVENSSEALAHELTSRDTVEAELKSEAETERDFRKAKSEFLLGLSHELRTPLNGILGLASLLSNTELNRDQRKLLATLERSAQNMLSRVSDVFDLSLLENNRVELRSVLFDPQGIAKTAVALFEPLASEKGLDFHLECGPGAEQNVIGDPIRVKQIVSHLLSNAIKFTPSGSVTLRVSAEPIDSDHVRVIYEVRDTGIGMDASLLAQANRGPSLQSGAHNGIGLSICWRLAWLKDGGLAFESVPDKGTTARASLRLQTEPAGGVEEEF